MQRKRPFSETKLLAAVRDNSTAGWELLFAQFNPLIKSILRWPQFKFTADEQQDVYQNIHLHLQSAIPRFRRESSLSWYIKKIAMNECVNEIRRKKRRRNLMRSTVQKTPDGNWNEMEFEHPDTLNPHLELVQQERVQMVRAALQALKATCRDSITMFYLQQRTYQEMSEQLGITQNTIGSRLSKCLDKLHKELRMHPLFERSES